MLVETTYIYHYDYIGGTLQPWQALGFKCLAYGHKVAVTGLELILAKAKRLTRKHSTN